MAIKVGIGETGCVIEVRLSGKLEKKDYEAFVPEIEQRIKQHGRLRILLEMHDFHGWSAGAMWEDLKFDLKHFNDIERVAMVGETRWQEGMAKFCRPFTAAKIKYFEHDHVEEARTWLKNE